MRFAITATDRYLGVFHALLERGWSVLKVFTTPVDGRLHHHTALIELARKLAVPVQISRLTPGDLAALSEAGCETLIVASYRWRIPAWRTHLRYAVNFHPSLLPLARGPYPVPAAILQGAARWGVSCHRLEAQFDSGDLLKVLEFPLDAGEDHDSLDLKVQLAARRLAGDVAEHFVEYWDGARPQGAGSYYPQWSIEDRRLDFGQSVEQILRRVRAFGRIECVADINGARLFVRRAVGWQESHGHEPGAVVHWNSLAMVITASDGYIGLTEWSLIDPDAVTGTFRR
jgi:methionyl-tRNA formyltransferase